jgi:hypothetical protein
VNYLEWALEVLPLEMNGDRQLAQADIEFPSDDFYGQQILSALDIAGDTPIHQLKNAARTSLCLGRHALVLAPITTKTPWRPRGAHSCRVHGRLVFFLVLRERADPAEHTQFCG